MNETVVVIEDIDAMTNAVLERKGQNGKEPQLVKPQGTYSDSDSTDSDDNRGKGKDKGKDKDKDPGVTLSGILNAIDGIHNNHGMILIITSNMPEKLDKALLRDGRVDDKIYFGYCNNKSIYGIMKNFYNGKFTISEKDFDKLSFPDAIAPCRVENAMKRYWDNPDKAVDYLIKGTKTELEKFDY